MRSLLHDTIENRVHAGALALDRVRPDWFRRVDMDILDIKSCERCVLGQVFENFTIGLGRLFGMFTTTNEAIAHGFDTDNLAEIRTIHRFWGEEINARLSYSRCEKKSADYMLAV